MTRNRSTMKKTHSMLLLLCWLDLVDRCPWRHVAGLSLDESDLLFYCRCNRVLSVGLYEMIVFCWYRQLWPAGSA